ncbi:hypothetical protein DUI87_33270 [Hirundo rustica rustica]|uniref:Uncharacterized protein n=1 Tax=Hirundo rustica rustica TaxID=333673 RepID=A0A3M0INL7_HIRRU|nr:hypothetical protein DUI87_33270 [Hirundo rustica rustica]
MAMTPGTLQVVATSPGIPQVTPGNLGTPQVMATTPGTPQPRGLGTLQAQPQGLEPPRVGSGVPDVQGTLQAAPGAVVPEEGTLPPELRDLELLPGGQDMLELLQSLEGLEPASGSLGALEEAELVSNVGETSEERFQLSPGSAALLDRHDPFLPQPEDSALPSAPSLFSSADFPPLCLDASDFQ